MQAGDDGGVARGTANVLSGRLVQCHVLGVEACGFGFLHPAEKTVYCPVPAAYPVMQIRENREIITMFLNALQRWAHRVVNTLVGREELLWVKSEVAADTDKAFWRFVCSGGGHATLEAVKGGQSQADSYSFEEMAAINVWCSHVLHGEAKGVLWYSPSSGTEVTK